MRSPSQANERGSVTAEFALLLPAVMVVLLCCLAAVQLVSLQVRLQDAASTAARILARGESESVASSQVAALVGGASLVREDRGDLACVSVSAAGRLGALLGSLRVSASACALGGNG